LQNPDNISLVLKYLKDKNTDEMPALMFDWNQDGFNDTPVTNCRNGVVGQTKVTLINNILTYGATDFRNMNIFFIFPKGEAIGDWANNVVANFHWYEIIIYFLDSLASA